jgi:hypothetical protein
VFPSGLFTTTVPFRYVVVIVPFRLIFV